MSETDDLEALREQAEVEKIYREAVETLITFVISYLGGADGEDVIEQLMHDFPGSTQAFWLGVMEMTAEALSEDGLIPDADVGDD